ncbi:formylmethanofuran dehydrogenase subunit A [Azospirillum halopraeferens]|uniref:formylmethanofuran dehydrogenase subunit A n=1 Tax=Azospirillum halopraeferens TaxID=34010 RepID=UPI00041297C2|nr:formylmethanofuran dehydrogenase subunit A [Azospirillum halopraeferens]
MRIKLAGGRVYDPANGFAGATRDLFVEDGRIVADPGHGWRPDEVIDVAGKVVMAGAIDIHSHIGGGKVNIARSLMTEDHRDHRFAGVDGLRSGSGVATPSTFTTGYRYAEMGYTAAFEPAMVASNARHAHMELSDTPLIDKGAYVMLGNDDLLLRLLAEDRGQQAVNDYVAWIMGATRAMAVKVVNPGGIFAFKENLRQLGLDEEGPYRGLTPRTILRSLARAVRELGVPHPLHVHCNDLGIPGNIETTLATVAAADGMPLHLTHVQFHSYGREGDRRFSSAAARLAELVNRTPTLSVDVGQILFGQTVTASGDTMSQHRNSGLADPAKWVCMDIECDGGCGLVPFRYRDRNFVNALQWAIGLELFLLIEDPWRVFLTTDHPNGAPFTSYPHLIRLLMDRSFREEKLATIHPAAAAATVLGSIRREYSLCEIAIMTRAAPARSLGLEDRGHLGPGAVADIVVYTEHADRERMFGTPDLVFKGGRLIARDGQVVAMAWGDTHVVRPGWDPAIERVIGEHMAGRTGLRAHSLRIGNDEFADGRGALVVHPCRKEGGS